MAGARAGNESRMSFPLSHVLVGEGRGEGDFERRFPLVLEITLTLTLSHEYVREGTGGLIYFDHIHQLRASIHREIDR